MSKCDASVLLANQTALACGFKLIRIDLWDLLKWNMCPWFGLKYLIQSISSQCESEPRPAHQDTFICSKSVNGEIDERFYSDRKKRAALCMKHISVIEYTYLHIVL